MRGEQSATSASDERRREAVSGELAQIGRAYQLV